jgi:hypothetical protein
MNKYLKISIQTTFLLCVTMLTAWQSIGQGSLYTGQAPIGIPLYTVSDGKTQIPIGLNYNASGIKPNEHPGWVGQNWNLQAGGFVARKVNGLPDDMKADFKAPQLNGKTVTVKGFYFSSATAILVSSNWNDSTYTSNLVQNSYDRYLQLQTSDTDPDEFYFSLPDGSSGSFLLDESGSNWIVKGNKTFKISLLGFSKVPFSTWKKFYDSDPSAPIYTSAFGYDCIKDNSTNVCTRMVATYSNTFSGFVVTDDKGNEFTFGGDSTSIQYSMPLYQQYYAHWKADAWFLTKVKPMGGTEIKLQYEEFSEKFNGKDVGGKFQISMFSTLQRGTNYAYPANNSASSYNGAYNANNDASDSTKQSSGELIRPVYLKKIESVRDSVIFYKSRSVEMEYQKDLFRSSFLYWKQYIVFYQKYNIITTAIEKTKPAPPWLPNTWSEDWNTTDSLDKYLNKIGWAKLDRIKVYSKVSGESHAEIEYVLKYNNSGKNYTYQTIGNKIQRSGGFNERIRLDTVAQIAGSKSLIYKFDYYKSDTMSLPRYLDKDILVDHWGFYNKKKSFVDATTPRGGGSVVRYQTRYFRQRDATKSIEVARLGTIKSITFPTGGKTIYDYEQNTYSKRYDYGVVHEKITFNANPISFGQDSLFYSRRREDNMLFYGTGFYGSNTIDFKVLSKNTNSFAYTDYSSGSVISRKGIVSRGFFVDSVKIDTVGGLRVKLIKTIDVNGQLISKKTYSYKENYNKPNVRITSGILDARYGYGPYLSSSNWYGKRYKINGQNTNYISDNYGLSSDIFNAIAYSVTPPVTYSEVSEENFDGSYTTYHFTNYYSKIAGAYLDEPIRNGYNSNNYNKIKNYSNFEPYVDKSFERGRLFMVESYRSDNKIVALQKMRYKAIGASFVKSIKLNSDFVALENVSVFNPFNFFANLVAEIGIGLLTGGSAWYVQAAASVANPVPFLLPNFSTDTYLYYSEQAYPQKIYTYNYEMISDSTWTFDYADPTKKFVTANYYKYNSSGQLRELKRVQNDGLELLTNNKYVKDYDFDSAYQAFLVSADFTSCTNQRTSCEATCANEPDPQVQDYCYRECQNQESNCKQNLFSASIAANPTSSNLLKMQMKNMVGYPVESTVKRKNINTSTYKVLGGTLNFYGEFNANGTQLYAPQSILKMKQTQTNATADTSKLDASGAFIYDQTRYTVKTFETTPSDGYGAYGNLTKYVGRDGVLNTMTHNAMNYPISKNIGITYNSNEFYSTMEYAPILGMIKTADQNNRKIRNRYDAFNRLRSVSKTLSESGQDNDYLLKLYDYHYFNDNSDIVISDFVTGGCNGDNPASCTLRATLVPNSFMEMKVGSGVATTLTGSFEEGANTVTDPAKYTWKNPAGTLTTAAAFTIPALTTANLNSVLGTYYYKVEKGGCQACLKFTISKKTTATNPDLLAEEDK